MSQLYNNLEKMCDLLFTFAPKSENLWPNHLAEEKQDLIMNQDLTEEKVPIRKKNLAEQEL
jgi:hypothetical protein